MAAKTKKKPITVKVDRRPLVAAFFGFAVAVAVWMMFAAPAREDAETEAGNLTAVQQVLDANEAELAALKSGQERSATTLLARVRELDELLPQKLNVISQLAEVEQLAGRSGVDLEMMNPTEDEDARDAVGRQFTVQVTGSPAAVAQFLDRVLENRPLMTVTDVSLTTAKTEDGPVKQTLGFVLQIWSIDEPKLKRVS